MILQMYCYYKCSVALPQGAVGWSAVWYFLIILTHMLAPVEWDMVVKGNLLFAIHTNKVSKGAKIRNQVPHLTQDTNGKVTNSQKDTTNESQEVSPFPAVDHKVHINRRAQRHSKHKTEQKHKRSTRLASWDLPGVHSCPRQVIECC